MTMILKLYQVRGIKFLVDNPRALVSLPTGTGKTEIALRALLKLQLPAWVICPKSLVIQWERQIAARPGLAVTRVISFPDVQHHIEAVQFRFLSELPQIIIVDEPKPLKGATAVLENLIRYKIRTPRRIVLDATPVENNLKELWFLFRWLSPKTFGSLADFEAAYITSRGRYKNLQSLRDTLKPFVFRPTVAQPREKRVLFVPVYHDYKGKIAYEHTTLCKMLAASLKSKSPNALNRSRGLISKLRGFLSDPARGAAPKIAGLIEFLSKNSKRRGVIFVYKRDTAVAVQEALTGAGYKAEVFDGGLSSKRREKCRNAFNAGALQFLVATSAGERGVDLPTGNIVVHFDLPWTRASFDQRDRVSRLGNDDAGATKIVTFLLKNTVDEVMWSIVAAKNKLMIEPFEGVSEEFDVSAKSWGRFLNQLLGDNADGKHSEKVGEDTWFSRGKRLPR